jgi:hypothetical protein
MEMKVPYRCGEGWGRSGRGWKKIWSRAQTERGVEEKGGVWGEGENESIKESVNWRSGGENETKKAEGEKENADSREAAGRKREAGGKLYWEGKYGGSQL